MPRGNKVRIALTSEEEQALTMWANAGKTEQRMVQRAKVILLQCQGISAARDQRKEAV